MKSFTSTLIFIITSSFYSHSQKIGVVANDYTHFQTTLKKDTIDFVIADTSFTVKKPILLFCQGSLPMPLFFDFPEQGTMPVTLSNFDVESMKRKYHVVVISMPKTPLIVGPDHLNKSHCYVTDTTKEYSFHPDFLPADFLENYVNRANAVIHFLSKQKWINTEQLVVAGHSQGSHVALELAAHNKKVTQVGLFGFNPLGRIDQYIRKARKDAEAGEITWVEADSIQNGIYDWYKDIQKEDTTKIKTYNFPWNSFSKSQVSTLVELNIPIYIAYGSEDINGDFCDIIPLYFIEKKKTNLTLKRFPNLEHNFFPIKEDGSPVYEKGEWKEVMNAFVEWSLL